MSQSIQDDEIDLFELFATLWAGKWLIALSTAIFLLGGFAYIQLATKVYQLEAKLQAPACPTSGAGYVDWDCANIIFDAAVQRLSSDWDEDFDKTVASFSAAYPKISLQVTEPKSLQFYQELLDGALDEVSTDLSVEASRVLNVLAQPVMTNISQTEVASQLNLKSQMVSDWLRENGSSIGSFVILPDSFRAPVSPKKSLILALSLVLGGFVGAAVVLVRKVIRDRVALV
jgi:hypothetical protein